jgi:hypothetical protein
MISYYHQMFLRYAQTHPKSLGISLLGGTTLMSIILFKIIDDGHEDYNYAKKRSNDPNQTKMTMDEARLIAMLENAKESSSKENVENAVNAQEQFMLPGRHRNVPKFMDKIDLRSLEILQNQHNKIDDDDDDYDDYDYDYDYDCDDERNTRKLKEEGLGSAGEETAIDFWK